MFPCTSLHTVHQAHVAYVLQHLQVGLVLDELLCATVKQADVGVTFLDRLSTELQD